MFAYRNLMGVEICEIMPIQTEDAAVRKLKPLLRQASPIQNPKWY
jgi:hypothetical protein